MQVLSKADVDKDVAAWLEELRNQPTPVKERPQITVETQVYSTVESVPDTPEKVIIAT